MVELVTSSLNKSLRTASDIDALKVGEGGIVGAAEGLSYPKGDVDGNKIFEKMTIITKYDYGVKAGKGCILDKDEDGTKYIHNKGLKRRLNWC